MTEHAIHNHPAMEQRLGVDADHVIVDRECFEAAKQRSPEVERLRAALTHCQDAAGPGPSCARLVLENERLRAIAHTFVELRSAIMPAINNDTDLRYVVGLLLDQCEAAEAAGGNDDH